MSDAVLIALITACVPALVTIVTTASTSRHNKRNYAKQSILVQILEDKFEMSEGRLPQNYQSIMAEFDAYSKAGGNSYTKEKVEEYKKAVIAFEAKYSEKKGADENTTPNKTTSRRAKKKA